MDKLQKHAKCKTNMGIYTVWLHLWEIARKGKTIERRSRLPGAGIGSRDWQQMYTRGVWGDDESVLKLECNDVYNCVHLLKVIWSVYTEWVNVTLL